MMRPQIADSPTLAEIQRNGNLRQGKTSTASKFRAADPQFMRNAKTRSDFTRPMAACVAGNAVRLANGPQGVEVSR